MNVLILGGAGFVGSSLAKLYKSQDSSSSITVFDNLRRRGSELNLATFKKLGIKFVHGDIRSSKDLEDLQGDFDLVIEASAEPSVSAGLSGQGLGYLIDTNLLGSLNFLEFIRQRKCPSIFLSTSRVYSISALTQLPFTETASRLVINAARVDNASHGLTEFGINEGFPTIGQGFRSLYGSTKLASELFIEEYAQMFDLPIVINRCGVIAGPGQFGKTDQGVFTLWVARHVLGGSLSYTGFGGQGKQVRDLLHPRDLFQLIQKQVPELGKYKGRVFCVGGGLSNSTSLFEYTQLCENETKTKLSISSIKETSPVDIPWYVTDARCAQETFDWRVETTVPQIVHEISEWIKSNKDELQTIFA